MEIIGRKEEKALMESYLKDSKSHFLAVVGRRRVGKTFLIREVYRANKSFEMTGLKDADLHQQLLNFTLQLNAYSNEEHETPENWILAFHLLTKELKKKRSKKKKVVFFDEIPWIASRKSGFVEALAHWWNNWASEQNIILVVCGSAASWMLENIVKAKGGLHNRITKSIVLQPFTLEETKAFLEAKNIKFSHYQIIQIYLAFGGIPHYLEQIPRGKSAAQCIQELCFTKDGILRTEFNNLYPALFEYAENHVKIIKSLSTKSIGLSRQEILRITGLSDGGGFSSILNELEVSGFISTFEPLEKKKKDTLYRLTDEYSLFYLSFIEGRNKLTGDDWTIISQSQEYKTWCGYAFENCCIKHIGPIKKALGISGVQSTVNSFLHRADDMYGKGFQIDMLIDRKDNVISICEMKFYADEFTINLDYANKIRTKKEGLRTLTKTKKVIHTTFITSYGVMENAYKLDLVDNDLTIDLFF